MNSETRKEIYENMRDNILSDCQNSIFGGDSTRTFSSKTVTPEEIFKDIQDAIDILRPAKKEFKRWEYLRGYYGPIFKTPHLIITETVA